jgi:predicted Zn-dependent protease
MARAALALAAAGQFDDANVIVDELKAYRPNDTLINELWLPTVRAAIRLRSSEAQEAIQELELTERFETAGEFYPQYLRGLAYLELEKPRQAVREFEKILSHRGEAPLSSIYPLAQLGEARALKDKAEYEKFFELWKDADPDLPALIAAKAEAA